MTTPNTFGSLANNTAYQEHLKQLDTIFDKIHDEIENLEKKPDTFKFQKLPLARVKKIMKADEDVKMISAEAPVLFAKACEMFIIELTHRSYYHTIENRRKTLQRSDIAQTIASTDIYDFLQDIIPKEELKEAQVSNQRALDEQNQRASATVLPGGEGNADGTPQMRKSEISYLHPNRNRNESGEQNEEENDSEELNAPGENMTSMLLEMDPSNLNQNDINLKKKISSRDEK